MSRFLLAASALTASALVQGANWIPSSPLVQIGNDCDIYFDAAASLEVTDNLYSSSTKTSATSWMVTPGFLLEYGKDSALSATISVKRTFVNFTDKTLSDLEDSRDALAVGIRFADGGPLSLSVDSSYRVTARNDDLQMQGLGGLLGATLVRQASYAHSFRADYKLTEKLSVGLGYSNSYNQYLDPVTTGAAGSYVYNTNTLTELNTKSMPLSFDYQAFEKLSFGLALQHDVTDYSAAPYYSQLNTPRPPLAHHQQWGPGTRIDPNGMRPNRRPGTRLLVLVRVHQLPCSAKRPDVIRLGVVVVNPKLPVTIGNVEVAIRSHRQVRRPILTRLRVQPRHHGSMNRPHNLAVQRRLPHMAFHVVAMVQVLNAALEANRQPVRPAPHVRAPALDEFTIRIKNRNCVRRGAVFVYRVRHDHPTQPVHHDPVGVPELVGRWQLRPVVIRLVSVRSGAQHRHGALSVRGCRG